MVSIIIPVYNEKSSINKVIDETAELTIDKEVIVVDDGSIDGTDEIIKNKKIPSFVKRIYFKRNKGKGAAIRAAVSRATGEYLIIQDADLEVAPKEILRVLKTAEEEQAEVVYGSRFLCKRNKFPILMLVGNKLVTWFTNILFLSRLTDVETPAKLFRREIIANIGLNSQGFDFETEITAKLLKRGYCIKETPISYKPRSRREGKKIRWFDGFIAIFTLLKYRILK
ncbi:MAG: glycosyltransferase family 2 protein [Candidatus Omnitrophica bacterium]|nr:glycosyltransferase family 2 protein [Candidatus Omnitrophota bacterium]